MQLRIKGVELEDEGKYTCVLSNDSGSVKTSARLTVTGENEHESVSMTGVFIVL